MATAFAPKISQVLMTPDPHHIPGYAGYCPQYKFRLGRTYGTLTSQLLTCPEVAHSPHLVLQPTQGPCDDAQPPEQQEKLLEVPRAGWRAGVLPVSCSMIPGYTGFIPRAQHFFAKTYLEICKEARSDFARQQRRAWGGQERPRAPQPCPDPAQGSKEPAAGIPDSDHRLLPTVTGRAPLLAAAAPHVSPYSMADDDPHKYFISGFTGFVPRARFLIGASFPSTTRRALLEFAQMSREGGCRPRAAGAGSRLPALGRTHPAAGGLLPHYTGYIPGERLAAWGRDPPGPIAHLRRAPVGPAWLGCSHRPWSCEGCRSQATRDLLLRFLVQPRTQLDKPRAKRIQPGQGAEQPRGLSPAVTLGTALCHRLQASASSPLRAQLTAPSSGPQVTSSRLGAPTVTSPTMPCTSASRANSGRSSLPGGGRR